MKTYVGFGFGPIQSGLFLYEAQRSGNFARFVVAEVDPALVAAVRGGGGAYTVNIARPDGIDRVRIEGVEVLNPRDDADRAALLSAIAESDELATCLPSVAIYTAGGDSSVAALLAKGLSQRKDPDRPTVLYAAENHNHAAELLIDAIAAASGGRVSPQRSQSTQGEDGSAQKPSSSAVSAPSAVNSASPAGGLEKGDRHLRGEKYAPAEPVPFSGASSSNSPCGSHAEIRNPQSAIRNVQALNTVIGKMSGVISDPEEMQRLDLAPLAPGIARAVLVEEFNRILVSRVELAGYRRGIDVFIEKDDLLPFEEAKLYGHNAIHALIGYLAAYRGHPTIAAAGGDAWVMGTARGAFLDESRPAMLHRHAHLHDPLFTPDGYEAYAADLLVRMTNPYLNDRTERICRDPIRKLGWDDRLFGTMRRALDAGVDPHRLALGAAAGVRYLVQHREESPTAPVGLPSRVEDLTRDTLASVLRALWGEPADPHRQTLIDLTWQALRELPDRG